MSVLYMIITATIVLGFLVFIHEGGHYLAARAFGVRVTEFMIGLPGPHIGVQRDETKFGVTAIPLGGYARVCGMEAGEENPHLPAVLATLYRRGTVDAQEVARCCGISRDDAFDALDELVEWGCAVPPRYSDESGAYRAVAVKPTKRQLARARKQVRSQFAGGTAGTEVRALLPSYDEGEARPVPSEQALYRHERKQQYRAQSFWKRVVILLAGIFANLLFAVLAFILVYSVIGFDYRFEDGVVRHVTVGPLRSIEAGFAYIGMVAQAIVNLFNPATAADTVQNSTSIVGIAIMSKSAAEEGLVSLLTFTAMISVSLGLMNLLPIPPLDGGRFVLEIVQLLLRRPVSVRASNALSVAGMLLFMGFFVVMLGQDVMRVASGFWV